MKLKKAFIALTFILTTGSIISCSNYNEKTSEEVTQDINIVKEKDDDAEYQARYTAIICNQAIVNVPELFYTKQKNMPKNEAITNYIESKGTSNKEMVSYYTNVLNDAYEQPIYYPELEKDPFFFYNNPEEEKKLDKLRDEFNEKQYARCLDELTEYTKENHELIFGSAYIPKP